MKKATARLFVAALMTAMLNFRVNDASNNVTSSTSVGASMTSATVGTQSTTATEGIPASTIFARKITTSTTTTTTTTALLSSTAATVTAAATTSCPNNNYCQNGECSLDDQSRMQCRCNAHFYGSRCTIVDLRRLDDVFVNSDSVTFRWPDTPSLSGYTFLYYQTPKTNADALRSAVTLTNRSATLSGLSAGMVRYVVCLVQTSMIAGLSRAELTSDSFKSANMCATIETGYGISDPYSVSFFIIVGVLGGVVLLLAALGCVAACGRRMRDSEKSKSWKWMQRFSDTFTRSGRRSGKTVE